MKGIHGKRAGALLLAGVLAAFDALVEEFNSTVGREKGIYVVGYSKGSVTDLETAISNSLNGKVGAEPMPEMFSSYSDTAFQAAKSGKLTNLSDYFTEEELSTYLSDYENEGRIGPNGALVIFSVT